jgi:hypothetical protein
MTNSKTAPYSESIKQTKTEDFYLTHSVWHNGYGACPETGVRSVIAGKVQDDFRLIQHGVRDFAWAEYWIIRCLRKRWDTSLICDFLQRAWKRRAARAVFL